MPASKGGRRWCEKGQHRRAERFFKSPKARTCSTCLRKRVAASSKDARLRETYDLSLAEWEQILKLQGGVCAICLGKRATFDTDHDHKLERTDGTRASIRGLLCRRCNRRLLPGATDNVDVLMRAIEYLRNPPAQVVLSAPPAHPLEPSTDERRTTRADNG